MFWDVFCRVIDNHGDLGVCWRLSVDLASRQHRVRLWVDDPTALAWMAPQGCAGVETRLWPDPSHTLDAALTPGDVVIEAFGCNPPDAFVARMVRPHPPAWINLEYLSAEDYVERSHGLLSPVMSGPGAGLRKWFFYPGFTPNTGGLIREPHATRHPSPPERHTWLTQHATAPRHNEDVLSLFCYAHAPVDALLLQRTRTPTLLLITPGIAASKTSAALGRTLKPGDTVADGALRIHALPYLEQNAFDALLRACDLNYVRGEDSFVRAQWAGQPFVWNIYPQDDGVHAHKLAAFERLLLADANVSAAQSMREHWAWWNGLSTSPPQAVPPLHDWRTTIAHWRSTLLLQADLSTNLTEFVRHIISTTAA